MIYQTVVSAVHTCYNIDFMLRNMVVKMTSDREIVKEWIETVTVDVGTWTELLDAELRNELVIGYTAAGSEVEGSAVAIILSYGSSVLIYKVPPTHDIPTELTPPIHV
ncbi:hypothetical protein MTR_3g053770 [Medicago truncatula]|uniref:Uncharacterized protein n=2 Tax=Medicago truncatula TaxID=3880 RepID=A0A072V615_MEDTR|nr:hypothetical protein MTR_3g053770 [Medicago truncatula]